MGRTVLAGGSAMLASALAVAWVLAPVSDAPSPGQGAVTVVRGDDPAPGTPVAAAQAVSPASPAVVRDRPARALVERLAARDRTGGDVRMMTQVMASSPDAPGAQPFERLMTDTIASLPAFAAVPDAVNVSCTHNACEVAGVLPPGQDEASVASAFRDKDLERKLLAHGYTPGPVMVADAGDGRRGFVFYLNNEMRQ